MDNEFLVKVPGEDEIYKTMFGLDANSAPKPDGFTGKIFRTTWEVVQLDLVVVV